MNWLPIMCIMMENNGFIKFVNNPQSLIRNDTYYGTLGPFTGDPSYRSSQDISPIEVNGTVTGYSQGLAVKTGLQSLQAQNDLTIGPNYLLSLPQNTVSGLCMWTAPVRFLVDSTSTCIREVDAAGSGCSANGPLDAQLYAQPSTSGTAAPRVLKTQQEKNITNVIVNYLCDPDYSKYVRSSASFSQLVPADQVHYFSNSSTGEATDCTFDTVTNAYTCKGITVPVRSVDLPPRCSWDDGYTLPSVPSSSAGVCLNSVVRVLYNFTWTGQDLTLLTATIILADIPLSLTDANLTQFSQLFDTVFTNEVSVSSSSTSDNYTTVYPLSGNPGYTKLYPIISGISANVTTNSTEDLIIDTALTNRLSLWNPGPSGLCDEAERKSILFGTNALSGCILRLSFQDLTNCDNIRRLVLSGQDQMAPSNYISILGNTSFTNFSNWAPVFRQDVSEIVSANFSNEAFLNLTQSNFTYLSQLQGVCNSIPSGLHINILYTQAGLSNYQPIYTIVGAMINYSFSTWNWNCKGETATSCTDSMNSTQTFHLTTSVNFHLIPAVGTSPPSRYEQQYELPSYICKENGCLSQTFYPFMKINLGDSQQ